MKLRQEVPEYILKIYNKVIGEGENYERIKDVILSHDWEVVNIDDSVYEAKCSRCQTRRWFNISEQSAKYFIQCCSNRGIEETIREYKIGVTCNEAIIKNIIE